MTAHPARLAPADASSPVGLRDPVSARILWLILAPLGVIQLAVVAVNLSPLIDRYTVRSLFDINGEANLVAWLSSALLLAAAAGAALAAAADRAAGRRWRGWAALSAFMVILSADEVAGLHELIGEKAHRLLEVSWLPSLYTWVLVVGPVGLVAAVLIIRWLTRTIGLKSPTAKLGLLAVALWVMVPILEALDPSLGGPRVLSAIEESLETAGEALLLSAILLYLAAPGALAALSTRLSRNGARSG